MLECDKNVQNALGNRFRMIWGEAQAITLHFVTFFCDSSSNFQTLAFASRYGFSSGIAYDETEVEITMKSII